MNEKAQIRRLFKEWVGSLSSREIMRNKRLMKELKRMERLLQVCV